MDISFSNVEKIIFYDKEVQKNLPEMAEVFYKWSLGVRTANKSIIKSALFDFLNMITPQQINILEAYFKSPVTIEKFDSSIVKNYKINCNCLEELNNKFSNNLSISREGDLIYICQWR